MLDIKKKNFVPIPNQIEIENSLESAEDHSKKELKSNNILISLIIKYKKIIFRLLIILPILLVLFIFLSFKKKKVYKFNIGNYHLDKIDLNLSNSPNSYKKFKSRCQNKDLSISYDTDSFSQDILDNPQISIIIPVCNGKGYLPRPLRSIQLQKMKSVEILFVDDHSVDGTLETLEEYQKNDPRIKIIKNNETISTFYSRVIATYEAKGNYIIYLDIDDMFITNDLFDALLSEAKNNYDIIAFNGFHSYDNFNNIFPFTYIHESNAEIFQPELTNIVYRNNNNSIPKHLGDDHRVWGKLIKKSVMIETYEKIGKDYYKKFWRFCEDEATTFMLFRTAKSYKIVSKYGLHVDWKHEYIYKNRNSTINTDELYFGNILDLVDFLFNKTENTFSDKEIPVQRLYKYKDVLSILATSTDLINKLNSVLDKLLKCDFISEENKYIIESMKKNDSSILNR